MSENQEEFFDELVALFGKYNVVLFTAKTERPYIMFGEDEDRFYCDYYNNALDVRVPSEKSYLFRNK